MYTREEIAKQLLATGKSERLLSEETGLSSVTIGRLRRNEGKPRKFTLIGISDYLDRLEKE